MSGGTGAAGGGRLAGSGGGGGRGGVGGGGGAQASAAPRTAIPRGSDAPTAGTRAAPAPGATTTPWREERRRLCGVALDIGNQRQLPRAPDRRGDLPLAPRTHCRQDRG